MILRAIVLEDSISKLCQSSNNHTSFLARAWTLSLKSTQSFETNTEVDLEPYTWDPENAQNDYYRKTRFQGDVDAMGYGIEEPKILTQSKPLPRRINPFELRALEHHDESAREPIKNYILPGPTKYVVQILEEVKNRFRRDSTILFLQRDPGIIRTVNENVFPDSRTRPNYITGGWSHRLVSFYHLYHFLLSPE